MNGVRLASPADAGVIATIQVRAWQEGYRSLVPEEALAEMTSEVSAEQWHGRWAEAVTYPPSPRHRVLVAVTDEGAAGPVAGFAACAPADDPDQDPRTVAELVTLVVDPGHAREGHGSRLLAAAVDHMREDGFATAISWVLAADEARRGFLAPAGWEPDGAFRTVDMGEPVTMVRLHTDISTDTQTG